MLVWPWAGMGVRWSGHFGLAMVRIGGVDWSREGLD
jgi:hypothetical protein